MKKRQDLIGFLLILGLTVLYSWMVERDNHPFNDVDYVQVEQS
jgi:hypothetical protein